MSDRIVEPVLQVTRNVFATMADFEPLAGQPQLKTDQLARGDVTGLIGLEGKGMRGSLAITFPAAVIFDITQRMLRTEVDSIDEVVRDLTGELSNMLLGGVKSLLEHQGYDLGLSLPTVLSGKDHTVSHFSSAPTLLIPLTAPGGTFYIELSFDLQA